MLVGCYRGLFVEVGTKAQEKRAGTDRNVDGGEGYRFSRRQIGVDAGTSFKAGCDKGKASASDCARGDSQSRAQW
jgi:hypothetical protein